MADRQAIRCGANQRTWAGPTKKVNELPEVMEGENNGTTAQAAADTPSTLEVLRRSAPNPMLHRARFPASGSPGAPGWVRAGFPQGLRRFRLTSLGTPAWACCSEYGSPADPLHRRPS
ncbi:hypothetical protein [Pontibacter harenae]|uniref:hypothetical protein n=1 Tax=Pontibacter harenae TaxID=2894083 RepID=UPI001E3124C8|nr:hypothetical protein [Pontibacter harenae]MCC9169084.1 hypothetical protein [Pontibacter harenae]